MKNWSKGAKIIFWIAIILIVVAFAYQMKWLGNDKSLWEQIKGDASRQIASSCKKHTSATGQTYYTIYDVEVPAEKCRGIVG